MKSVGSDVWEEIKEGASHAIAAAMRRAFAELSETPVIPWDVPKEERFGDLATPVAFALAKSLRRPPRAIAEAIVAGLEPAPDLWARVEVAGAGFINLSVAAACWRRVVPVIREAEGAYGRASVGGGRRVQVEFVSANPTGPLHVGHGRGAALGDALANLLTAVGFQVDREYYINDAGTQMEILGRSVWARCLEEVGRPGAFPENGYRGEYIRDLAKEILAGQGAGILDGPEADVVRSLAAQASSRILAGIAKDLEEFGVRFDRWFSERSLYAEGAIRRAVELLRARGHVFDREGAVWFRSTALGDEKDRVVIRSTGDPTYLASDIAYHLDKFQRGYDTVIDIWGHDHHGYVPRMKGVVRALGYSPDQLQVLLLQLVRLLRGGEEVRMSTRAGDFVPLEEVVREVGRDAARFIFLTRRSDAPLDFDLDVAKAQSMENPVYYVQYAHARLASVQREADKAGLPGPYRDADLSLLALPEELALLKRLALYPDLIRGAALAYEPHRLTVYLQELAGEFHRYYHKHRFLSSDFPLSRARLALATALRTVFANALGLLGVTAPERM